VAVDVHFVESSSWAAVEGWTIRF